MISKGEVGMTGYVAADGTVVAEITQKGNVFYFYEYSDGDFIKLGKGYSPLELERKYNVKRRMGMKDDE